MLDPIKDLLTSFFAEAKPLGVIVISVAAAFLSIVPAVQAMSSLKSKKFGEAGVWIGALVAIWIVAGTAMNFVLNLGNKLGDSINQKANGIDLIVVIVIISLVYVYDKYKSKTLISRKEK